MHIPVHKQADIVIDSHSLVMRLWKSMVTATHMGWRSSSGRKPHTLTFMALVPGSDASPAKKKGCSVKLYDFQHRPSSVENLWMRSSVLTPIRSDGLKCTSATKIHSVLDSLDLTLSLHSHDETARVQDAVVVRPPQRPPPGVAPV